MKVRGAMIVAALAFAFTFTSCSDSVVGTDDGASTPVLAKGGNGGGGGGGKPGGGEPTDFRPVTVTFENLGIASDGGGAYADGDCGVWANVGNFYDARLDTDRNYKGKITKQCDRRELVFYFTDGTGRVSRAAFMNIDGLDLLTKAGQTKTTEAQFNVCGTLVYEKVLATRTSTGWTVTTEDEEERANDLAYCSFRDTNNNMPFTLTITEQ
jgi:hypothetical protein